MIPHGSDLLDSEGFAATTEDLLSILVRLRELWPEAVVETDTHPPIPLGDANLEFIPTGPLREVFVYRTKSACEMWTSNGWTEKFDNDLIHILATNDSLTLVGGDEVPVEVSLWASRLAGDLKTLAASRQPPSA